MYLNLPCESIDEIRSKIPTVVSETSAFTQVDIVGDFILCKK